MEEAKTWSRVLHDLEDPILESLIDAAVSKCNTFCKHFLFRSVIERELEKPYLKIAGINVVITEIAVKHKGETTFTIVPLSSEDLSITNGGSDLCYKSSNFVSGSVLRVKAETGIDQNHHDWERIKTASLFMVSSWYNNRDDKVKQMPTVSENLLIAFKDYTLI